MAFNRDAHIWQSLRVRLPLFLCLVIAGVLAVFIWTAHRTLEAVLIRAGGDRAQAAADQVNALMAQGVARGSAETRRVAGDPRVAQFLTHPSPDTETTARTAIAALAVPAQPPVQLWTRDGIQILEVFPAARAGAAPVAGLGTVAPPRSPGLTPFRTVGHVVVYELVVEVDGGHGFLVVPRTLATAQTSETINRLVGSGAVFAIGNQSGDVWSDFGKPVPAPGPAVPTSARGVSEHVGSDGGARLGAVSLVPGTPWAVWIDFPRETVLAPARTMLRRMVGLAALFVTLAALLAAIVSARITTPLNELTLASEAVATGRYDGRVPDTRRDEIGRLGGAFNVMTARVATAQGDLERRVRDRTGELEEAMRELEAFSYSVSHDLRAPLRHVEGFATLLDQSSGPHLGTDGRRHVQAIRAAAVRMGKLIDDLLAFSRVSRTPLAKRPVPLDALIEEARSEMTSDGAAVAWHVEPLPVVDADPALLRLAVLNLLSNAVKYSSKQPNPRVEIGVESSTRPETIVFVRDNGDGFDMQYAHKLFGVFQRLHSPEEFEGTGIGLANVRRIIQRHGGRTWATGAVKKGATFYFSLPDPRPVSGA